MLRVACALILSVGEKKKVNSTEQVMKLGR